MFQWTNSIRAVAVVMVLILLFVVVVGSFMGRNLSDQVGAMVNTVITGVVIAYFGKRDNDEERGK